MFPGILSLALVLVLPTKICVLCRARKSVFYQSTTCRFMQKCIVLMIFLCRFFNVKILYISSPSDATSSDRPYYPVYSGAGSSMADMEAAIPI